MSENVVSTPAVSSANVRSRGRWYFWAGVAVSLLGVALVKAQLSVEFLFMPWYAPVLATLGALLLLVSVLQYRSIPRIVGLLLLTVFACYQWYFLGVILKLPDYHGPAQAGKQFPPFTSTLADGRSFSDQDLRDGSRRVLTFFRGRW